MAIGGGVWFSGTAAAAPAQAEPTVLSAQLVPSVPSDAKIFGVGPGAKPWVITSGHVHLSADGTLTARVKGLVIPPPVGTNPLPEIAAVVFCGGTQAATAGPVAFSTTGDAQIDAQVALPSFCPVPAVLIEPAHNGMTDDMYIAFDGKASK